MWMWGWFYIKLDRMMRLALWLGVVGTSWLATPRGCAHGEIGFVTRLVVTAS